MLTKFKSLEKTKRIAIIVAAVVIVVAIIGGVINGVSVKQQKNEAKNAMATAEQTKDAKAVINTYREKLAKTPDVEKSDKATLITTKTDLDNLYAEVKKNKSKTDIANDDYSEYSKLLKDIENKSSQVTAKITALEEAEKQTVMTITTVPVTTTRPAKPATTKQQCSSTNKTPKTTRANSNSGLPVIPLGNHEIGELTFTKPSDYDTVCGWWDGECWWSWMPGQGVWYWVCYTNDLTGNVKKYAYQCFSKPDRDGDGLCYASDGEIYKSPSEVPKGLSFHGETTDKRRVYVFVGHYWGDGTHVHS